MDPEMKKFIDNLRGFAGDVDHSETMMREASSILQSIFDPENQPSQYGTALLRKQ